VMQDCQIWQLPTTAGEAIGCTTPRPTTVIWRIDRTMSNKGRRRTRLSDLAGDLVSAIGGGCVKHEPSISSPAVARSTGSRRIRSVRKRSHQNERHRQTILQS
jgi:hypothetical protein